jgi:muramoyltetrapeptide carboxypeptidase
MFRALCKGAGVAVVAPSSHAPVESFQAGLDLLADRYEVVRGYHPQRAGRQEAPFAYLAGADAERAAALNAAIRDPQVGAIFCARGGYGATRLLALSGGQALDLPALAARGVPLVGFSDITALHQAVVMAGATPIHGPVVNQLPALPESDREALFALLEGRATPRLEGLGYLVGGRARGRLRGGNLALLASLCGTPQQPRFNGAVVLLEDVGEAPYRLDRMLTQLLATGALHDVAGVVLGDFAGCDAEQGQPPTRVTALEVLGERLGPLRVPIVTGAPVGHGARNVALPLGVEVELDAEAGTLEVCVS